MATLDLIFRLVSIELSTFMQTYCKMRQLCKELYFLPLAQSSANSQTEDLMLSDKLLLKMRKRIGPKANSCETMGNTDSGSEA